MTATDIKEHLHKSLIEGIGDKICIVILGDGEEIGSEPIRTRYVLWFSYPHVNAALLAIEKRAGESLLGKKLTYGVKPYKE